MPRGIMWSVKKAKIPKCEVTRRQSPERTHSKVEGLEQWERSDPEMGHVRDPSLSPSPQSKGLTHQTRPPEKPWALIIRRHYRSRCAFFFFNFLYNFERLFSSYSYYIGYIPHVVQYIFEPILHAIVFTSPNPLLPAPTTGNYQLVLHIWVYFISVIFTSLLYFLRFHI